MFSVLIQSEGLRLTAEPWGLAQRSLHSTPQGLGSQTGTTNPQGVSPHLGKLPQAVLVEMLKGPLLSKGAAPARALPTATLRGKGQAAHWGIDPKPALHVWWADFQDGPRDFHLVCQTPEWAARGTWP